MTVCGTCRLQRPCWCDDGHPPAEVIVGERVWATRRPPKPGTQQLDGDDPRPAHAGTSGVR